jgi:hypothetical protein
MEKGHSMYEICQIIGYNVTKEEAQNMQERFDKEHEERIKKDIDNRTEVIPIIGELFDKYHPAIKVMGASTENDSSKSYHVKVHPEDIEKVKRIISNKRGWFSEFNLSRRYVEPLMKGVFLDDKTGEYMIEFQEDK